MSTFPFTVSDRSLWKTPPRVVEKKAQDKTDAEAWKKLCAKVDLRDKKVCQVTGKRLTAGAVDGWLALERHHLELRSQSKARKYDEWNVITLSRSVHQLVQGGLLQLLDKAGEKAKDVREIRTIRWNRARVAVGKEPFTLKARKGWKVAA